MDSFQGPALLPERVIVLLSKWLIMSQTTSQSIGMFFVINNKKFSKSNSHKKLIAYLTLLFWGDLGMGFDSYRVDGLMGLHT